MSQDLNVCLLESYALSRDHHVAAHRLHTSYGHVLFVTLRRLPPCHGGNMSSLVSAASCLTRHTQSLLTWDPWTLYCMDVMIPIWCGDVVSEITGVSALLPLAFSFHHQQHPHADPAEAGGAERGKPDPAVRRGCQHHLECQASAPGAVLQGWRAVSQRLLHGEHRELFYSPSPGLWRGDI